MEHKMISLKLFLLGLVWWQEWTDIQARAGEEESAPVLGSRTLSPTYSNWKGKVIPLDFPTFSGKRLSSQNTLQRNDMWLSAQLGGS